MKFIKLASVALVFVMLGLSVGCGKSEGDVVSDGTGKTASAPISDGSKQGDPKKQSEWNTREIDVTKNGNMQVAIEKLKDVGDLKQNAGSHPAAEVFKTPWKFYGQIVQFTGQVAIVQDYPPNSDTGHAFGKDGATEIVAIVDDGTVIDYVAPGSSGDIQVGDSVTLYGYPTGQIKAKNQYGGETPELAVIGNSFAKE